MKPRDNQTAVGTIPKNWNHQTFGNLYEEPSRNGIYKTSGFHGRGTRIVNMGEMFGYEFISDQEMSRVFLTTRELSVSGLQDGDLLFGRRSVVPAGAGKCSLVVSPPEPITFESSIIRVRLVRVEACPRFYYYFFASPIGRLTVSAIVSGTNVKGIRATELRELTVPAPPIAEQEAIAEGMSDVDALIESLEQFLAKKRHLKQGAMQELLTGTRRLQGFSRKWEMKRMGEVFSISVGSSKSAYIDSGGRYWVVDMGSVSTDGRLIVSKATNYSGDFLSVGDLVMPKDDIGGGGIIGKVGYIDADDTYVLGDHVYCLTADIGDPCFLSYVINGSRTNSALRKKVIGSAQLGLGRKSVNEQEVPFPPQDEQAAIGTVLSDMDAEITALEFRIAKVRDIKQGMMQELFTGRIRLVDGAKAAT